MWWNIYKGGDDTRGFMYSSLTTGDKPKSWRQEIRKTNVYRVDPLREKQWKELYTQTRQSFIKEEGWGWIKNRGYGITGVIKFPSKMALDYFVLVVTNLK